MTLAFLPILAMASAIMALGSALQAALGMGLALITVPLLVLVDPGFVPGPMLFAGVALSAAMAWRERVAIARRHLSLAVLGLVAGTAVGAAALALVAGPQLPHIFGAVILLAVLLSAAGLRVPASRLALLAGGTASGVMGTMAGVPGPPIALVLQHETPARLRATLGAFFAIGGVLSIVALVLVGVFGMNELARGLALLPGTALGFLLAPRLGRRLDRQRLRIAVLAISGVSALFLVVR
jgi:uncharacterized membrane protein YfcA